MGTVLNRARSPFQLSLIVVFITPLLFLTGLLFAEIAGSLIIQTPQLSCYIIIARALILVLIVYVIVYPTFTSKMKEFRGV